MPGASSRELRSPAEFLQTVTRSSVRASPLARLRSRVRAPSVGSCALFTTSTRGVHVSPGIPSPTTFRPQRFARSRRLAPPRALRVCFAALPCPGFRFKGCLLRPSRTSSSPAVTSAPLAPSACRLPGASERRVDLEVVLSSRVRSVRRRCSPRRHPCPFLRFFRLPRAFHRNLGRAIARPPLAVLVVRCCVCPVP
jgi:hypothetical protein